MRTVSQGAIKRLFAALAMAALVWGGSALASAPTAAAHGTSRAYTVCHSGCGYRSIQSAINAAPNGALVSVGPGRYDEAVSIAGKRLTLTGAGGQTIINARGQTNGLVIRGWATAGTRVTSLVVENALQAGVLAQSTSHLSILRMTVRNNDQATPSDAATNFNDNPDYEALHLIGVTDSLIAGNTVANNLDGGIYLTNETGPATGNRVLGNWSLNNAVDCGITLASHVPGGAGVSYNLIEGNVSRGNGAAGVIIATPVPGGVATGNRVLGNTVVGNAAGGINIHGHAGHENLSHNQILGNRISGNGPDVPVTFEPTGISLAGTSTPNAGTANIAHTLVEGNVISQETYGIAQTGTSHTVLLGNQIDAPIPLYHA